MEKFLPVLIQQGEYIFRIYEGSLIKSNIKKPWVEPGYMLVDARLEMETVKETSLKDFEVELDLEEGFLKIGVYLSERKKENHYFDLKDYYAKEKIKKLFGIKQENFEPIFLFKELHEELLIYFKKKRKVENLYLYQPFILDSSPVILVSPMGMGKTLFSLWLSTKIANGIPTILWEPYEEEFPKIYTEEEFYYKPESVKVLYLCFEGNEEEIKEKKEQIRKGLVTEMHLIGKKEMKDFSIQFLEPLSKKSARKELRYFLSVFEPQFVVFDSITSALLGFPELKQSEFIFDYIASNLNPKGIASLLIMHPSKEDLRDERILPKGSILYLTHPRIVWSLIQTTEFEDGFQIEVKPVKENLGLKRISFKFNVLFKEKEEKWIEIKLVEIASKTKEDMKTEEFCMEYLSKYESATPEEISKFYQLNYDAVKKALSRLVQKGEVIRISRGKYALKKEETFKIEGNDEKIPF